MSTMRARHSSNHLRSDRQVKQFANEVNCEIHLTGIDWVHHDDKCELRFYQLSSDSKNNDTSFVKQTSKLISRVYSRNVWPYYCNEITIGVVDPDRFHKGRRGISISKINMYRSKFGTIRALCLYMSSQYHIRSETWELFEISKGLAWDFWGGWVRNFGGGYIPPLGSPRSYP